MRHLSWPGSCIRTKKQMSHELIAAIDAGTTGIRCSIVDREGAELSYSYQRVPTIYPAPGFAEPDPRTVINLSFQAVSQAIHNCPADPRDIIGLCITNIRNSFVPMDADGGFLTNMVIWQDQILTWIPINSFPLYPPEQRPAPSAAPHPGPPD